MRDSKTIMGAAAVLICGAWSAVYFSLTGIGKPPMASEPPQLIGRSMAREALDLLKPSGQLLVIARDTTAFENPASDLQLSAFMRGVHQAHAPVRVVRKLQIDPLRPVQVPPGDFFEMLRGAHEGDVIVSFMGPPLLTDNQLAQLKTIKPSVVAFCSGRLPEMVNLKRMFEEGLLHAAIVPKHEAARSTLSSQPAEAYVTITRANLAELAAAQSRSE